MFKFKKKDRWVKTDKQGFKHYGMKMDTGYINASGNDINLEMERLHKEAEKKLGKKMQFNYVQTKHFPKQFKRIKISVPGFKNFGLKMVSITDMETGQNLFGGYGFTIFGLTRCGVPNKVIEKMPVGKKYKITIQQT